MIFMKSPARFPVLCAALLLLALGGPPRLRAQTLVQTFSYGPNLAIPDNNSVGVSDTETVSSSIFQITSLQVTLNLTGNPTAYNGDFYAYLSHGATGFCVLLNREGRTATSTFGYADSGINVTFADSAANGDIHNYQSVLNPNGGALTGTWQPDGRSVDPANSLDTTARTTTLGSFNGLDANGGWTLYVADVSAGQTGTFSNWSLQVTGVPEPSTWLGGMLLLTVAALTLQIGRAHV